MRGLTKLYTHACEDVGCISNSELVRYFTSLDYMDDVEAAYPTCLDLRHNYLGDAGAAACFRVLPHMLWVRRVEAANIGCGPLGVKSLCEVFALRTAPATASKCRASSTYVDLFASSTQADAITTSMTPIVSAAADGDRMGQEDDGSAFAVVPLEYIDLSGNPIYAYTAGQLLKVLRMRRDWLWRFYRNGNGGAATPPPLQVVLDWDVLPKRTVARLQSLCGSVPEDHPLSHSQNLPLLRQIPGENVHSIYRILTSSPPDGGISDPCYTQFDATNPFLADFVRQINEHMKDYLLASYQIEPRTVNDEPINGVLPAAAYLCVEYGVDLLPFFNTQCTTGGIQTTPLAGSSNHGGEVVYNRVVDRVRVLLQALDATPQLLQEALARDHDGPLLRFYLDRLRASFRKIKPCSGQLPTDSTVWELPQDLEVMYHRVVSSLVCRRMEWTLLPAIEASEARIEEIKKYMVEYLLDGVSPPNIHDYNPQNLKDASDEVLFCGALTRWCAQAMYHTHNEAKSHAEWNHVYESMAHHLFKKHTSGTSDIIEGDCRTLDSLGHVSEEAQARGDHRQGSKGKHGAVCSLMHNGGYSGLEIPKLQVQARDGEGRAPMQFPCDRHCQVALRTIYKILKDPYTAKRLEVVVPLQKALPIEMRHFLVYLLICQSGRTHAGGLYVAGLLGAPSSLESFMVHREDTESDIGDQEMKVEGSFHMIGWSLVDIMAVLYNRKDRLMELFKAFTEWYRLRTIESLASRAWASHTDLHLSIASI